MSFDLFGTTSPDEIQERNGQDNQRVFDPTNNALLIELLDQVKDLHKTIKQIHNMEI